MTQHGNVTIFKDAFDMIVKSVTTWIRFKYL